MGGQLVTATSADGVPPATLIVPRRNNGPVVQLDLAHGSALSVQYTGFSPTFELETFLLWDRARNLRQFEAGLQDFAVGSQNWAYADTRGNIAYFTSGEMPVREDLQAGTVNGLPPWFIRNGQGGNEWLPVTHPQPHQAIPYEIYPAAEMPHIINPPGWFASANNDPAGTTLDNDPLNQTRPGGGIYYLNYSYDGFRAGRIEQMLRQRLGRGAAGHKISMSGIEAMQADTTLLDAEYFVPHISRAFADAKKSGVPQLAALAADPRVAEAVGRLGRWDFTTPTGIPQGYDAGRVPGSQPSPREIADSVAATIYAEWRSRAVTNIIDDHLGGLPVPDDQFALAAMKHLLDTFATAHGVGASGIDFFAASGITDPAASRDYLLLASLRDALDLLAGPAFGPAFHESTSQNDYRWGLLHRIVLAHPLGGPFSVPPAFGQFPAPLPGLAGIPVDGGFETVDAATHDVRAADANGFMFDSGPARRFVASVAPRRTVAVSALPGGTSADPASPFYLNLLRPYLTDDYYPALLAGEIHAGDSASGDGPHAMSRVRTSHRAGTSTPTSAAPQTSARSSSPARIGPSGPSTMKPSGLVARAYPRSRRRRAMPFAAPPASRAPSRVSKAAARRPAPASGTAWNQSRRPGPSASGSSDSAVEAIVAPCTASLRLRVIVMPRACVGPPTTSRSAAPTRVGVARETGTQVTTLPAGAASSIPRAIAPATRCVLPNMLS